LVPYKLEEKWVDTNAYDDWAETKLDVVGEIFQKHKFCGTDDGGRIAVCWNGGANSHYPSGKATDIL
jgi:hypothetical protein